MYILPFLETGICPKEGRAIGEGDYTFFIEWGEVDSCETCRRECLYFQHMMNHMEYEYECDQEQGHYQGQQPPIFWGVERYSFWFRNLDDPMVQRGSCFSLLIVSDDDGPFPLKHVRLTCAQ